MKKTRGEKSHATVPLKGLLKFFSFLHQTTPPSPIRGYLGPFLILTIFHVIIQVLNHCASFINNTNTFGSCFLNFPNFVIFVASPGVILKLEYVTP